MAGCRKQGSRSCSQEATQPKSYGIFRQHKANEKSKDVFNFVHGRLSIIILKSIFVFSYGFKGLIKVFDVIQHVAFQIIMLSLAHSR